MNYKIISQVQLCQTFRQECWNVRNFCKKFLIIQIKCHDIINTDDGGIGDDDDDDDD